MSLFPTSYSRFLVVRLCIFWVSSPFCSTNCIFFQLSLIVSGCPSQVASDSGCDVAEDGQLIQICLQRWRRMTFRIRVTREQVMEGNAESGGRQEPSSKAGRDDNSRRKVRRRLEGGVGNRRLFPTTGSKSFDSQGTGECRVRPHRLLSPNTDGTGCLLVGLTS